MLGWRDCKRKQTGGGRREKENELNLNKNMISAGEGADDKLDLESLQYKAISHDKWVQTVINGFNP